MRPHDGGIITSLPVVRFSRNMDRYARRADLPFPLRSHPGLLRFIGEIA